MFYELEIRTQHKKQLKPEEKKMIRITTIVMVILTAICCSSAMAAGKPLKVYILAGQSNMQGQAKVETFDYIGDDPSTAPMLKEMVGPDGRPRVCENVWISSYGGAPGKMSEGHGKLTAGYGARKDLKISDGKIGPELTFGIYTQKMLNEPVLIIKTAWGGKSLNTDFRPPSAGPYEFSEAQLADLKKRGKDIEEVKAEKAKKTGEYYRHMMEHVKKVLADPKRICPVYDEKAGYELAGFVWFQGFNDMVDGQTYPNRHKPGGLDMYSQLLADFIRDVRKDLSAPKMPFVIGVIGVGGPIEDVEPRYKEQHKSFRAAMAAPASLPEFKGNVVAVQTALYWDRPLAAIEAKIDKVGTMAYYMRVKSAAGPNEDGTMTKEEQEAYLKEYKAKLITPEDEALWKRGVSNAGYHYLGCAKTMALIGKAFAEAVVEMRKK